MSSHTWQYVVGINPEGLLRHYWECLRWWTPRRWNNCLSLHTWCLGSRPSYTAISRHNPACVQVPSKHCRKWSGLIWYPLTTYWCQQWWCTFIKCSEVEKAQRSAIFYSLHVCARLAHRQYHFGLLAVLHDFFCCHPFVVRWPVMQQISLSDWVGVFLSYYFPEYLEIFAFILSIYFSNIPPVFPFPK